MARQSTTQRRPAKSPVSDDAPMADCAQVCNQTLAYCLDQGGDHVEASHLKAMIDCIDVCTLTARLHGRGSPLGEQAMELCAEACKACEESCEGFEGDETMQLCAATCRECYEHCRSM